MFYKLILIQCKQLITKPKPINFDEVEIIDSPCKTINEFDLFGSENDTYWKPIADMGIKSELMFQRAIEICAQGLDASFDSSQRQEKRKLTDLSSCKPDEITNLECKQIVNKTKCEEIVNELNETTNRDSNKITFKSLNCGSTPDMTKPQQQTKTKRLFMKQFTVVETCQFKFQKIRTKFNRVPNVTSKDREKVTKKAITNRCYNTHRLQMIKELNLIIDLLNINAP